jgi:SAM-dependent methyltransferase
MAALESRHLSELRVPEVTRALRAVSSAYVQRRHAIRSGAPLDSAGKRAAFALFYGPLHYLAVSRVLDAMGAGQAPPSILDLGCGTGAAGAAWAVERDAGPASVLGIDRHPWAVAEARWTYRQFGIAGTARTGDLTRLPRMDRGWGALSAYVLNELSPPLRDRVLRALLRASEAGTQVLVLEPVAKGIAPWWDDAAVRFRAAGGRADDWRFPVDLPPIVQLLDRAAGLDHRELTVRTLACHLTGT